MDSILDEVRRAFRGVPRPAHFVDPSHCEECAEHDATFLVHTPETIGLEQFGDAGWDPICFLSEQGYAYYMPALARIVLSAPAEYLGAFLSHLSPHRIASFSSEPISVGAPGFGRLRRLRDGCRRRTTHAH